ncbi:MAG: CoA transferase [Proteobacteria bacterium]|nr:CoA transferase [Pseudomonadota bacterium]
MADTMTDDTQRPLSGIRVVGLEQYMAGPYCTMLLADAGAEVIKIERPGSGDPRRAMPPFAEKGGRRKAAGFMGYNRNKKSLALNLRSEGGQEIFRKLARSADVVVENLRPGSMTKMGLGQQPMRAANPRLVWAIISGFGQMEGYRGPYSDRPAFDIVAEAMSGIMNLVGFADKPPSWTIYGMADVYTGQVTAYGILQALFMRERTGAGQLVDSAMFDNMLALNESMVALYSVAGQIPERGKPRNLWPRGAYEAKDGYIALNVPDNIIWSRLCQAMGRDDLIEDERSATGTARAANVETLQPIIEGWLRTLTREQAVDTLNAIGVPCGPVYTAEDVFNDPQVKARGMILPIEDPEFGTFGFARSTPHLSAAPELPANPAPNLGQHTREILQDLLGYDPKDVDRLAAEGVVQTDDA